MTVNKKSLPLSRVVYIVPAGLLILAWEALASWKGSPLFPPFSAVARQFYTLLVTQGSLWTHITASLFRVTAGFVLGSAAGLLAGVLIGWNRLAAGSLGPLVSIFYPIPALGWLPLLMLWVGLNEALPVLIVFICCFFPVLYNTASGIRNVDARHIRAARTLGASELQILRSVVLPLALPSIFTGLKLEAGMAWRVIIAAEMVAVPTGIGVLMMKAESLIRVDTIMVCLAVLSLMCFSFEKMIRYFEKRFTCYWR
ncbi:MAG: ABC transporter permease [Peptococcaceae bacterium]|jgi:NitT/TauT family transport system permease protein|nr:ABC transporter permease [Peptococcaceae bacterium]MDH7524595.1 ABC transporter permease [Peptococcaceae bacterium]